MDTDAPITDLLNAWSEGDKAALDELVGILYPELRDSAARLMAHERASHTLQPTALVNELYVRLLKLKKVSWESRVPFFAFSANLMRQALVEHARSAGAEKRGGKATRLSMEGIELPVEEPVLDVIAVNEALEKLEEADPRLARGVELRFFSGLTEEEIAATLDVSRSVVQRDWALAKRLLAKLLSAPGSEGTA